MFNADPPITQENNCPNNSQAGILSAFKDEQNTIDKYLMNADYLNDYHELKRVYQRIAKDEQKHAVWYLYLMDKER